MTTVPATILSVVASSSAKGPPKQYPGVVAIRNLDHFTKMRIWADQPHSSSRPCLYNTHKVNLNLLCHQRYRLTINFPHFLDPFGENLRLVCFHSVLVYPWTPIKTRFIHVILDSISKKVVNPKDEEPWGVKMRERTGRVESVFFFCDSPRDA